MRLIVTVAALAAACAGPPQYSYRPTAATARQDAPKKVGGDVGAEYQVARGEVLLLALGVADTKPPIRKEPAVPMMHVRMVVHNATREVWNVTGSDQKAYIPGRFGAIEPRFALCDGVFLPSAVIMPGETRTLDLFYNVPEKLPTKMPPIRVDWRVRAPADVIARQSTAFEPHEVPRPVVVVPAPNPRKMARRLVDGQAPPDGAKPNPTDVAGGLGH